MKPNNDTPSIRFAGFTDAWEQRKVSEIGTFSKGTGYSKSDIRDKGTPLILYGRLYTKYETVIREVDTFTTPKDGSVYSRGGEVIVPASGETAEDISIASVVEKAGVILGGDLNIITPQSGIDSAFLALSISHGEAHRSLSKLAQGKSVVHIHNSDIQTVEVGIPVQAEQESISQFFEKVDRLITLHQRKYDQLVNIKKSMLEKMFPKNGELVPEVRFAGFTDAWEQRRLASCATFRRGSFPQPYGKKEWYDGDGAMPFVQVADVTDSMNLADDTKQKISKIAQDMSIFAKKGSVLVTLQGSIGRVAITQYEAFIDRTILIFENYRTKTDAQFWAYLIKQKFIDEARSAPGGTIKTITKEALSDFEMKIPRFFEQEKIGLFLSLMDDLITLHQRKLERLQNIKKACLEKMFV